MNAITKVSAESMHKFRLEEPGLKVYSILQPPYGEATLLATN